MVDRQHVDSVESVLRGRRARIALFLAGVAIAAAAVAVALAGSSGSRRRAALARAARSAPRPPPRRIPLSRLVGQMVMAGMDGQEASPELLGGVRSGQLGGVILFTQNVGPDPASTVAELQRAARAGGNPALLIGIDQEGGPIKRISDAPPWIAPRAIASAASAFHQGS